MKKVTYLSQLTRLQKEAIEILARRKRVRMGKEISNETCRSLFRRKLAYWSSGDYVNITEDGMKLYRKMHPYGKGRTK